MHTIVTIVTIACERSSCGMAWDSGCEWTWSHRSAQGQAARTIGPERGPGDACEQSALTTS